MGREVPGIPDQSHIGSTAMNLSQRIAQQKSVKSVVDTAPHLIIRARAGTGKTTTLVEGLKVMMGVGSTLTPSAQQQAVWDSLRLSSEVARSVCMVAFNKSIATTLQERVPRGVEAMTLHSMGFRAVKTRFGNRLQVNQYRSSDILSRITGVDTRRMRATDPVMVKAVLALVDLAKTTLADTNDEDALRAVADYYGVDMTTDNKKDVSARVLALVPQVLEAARDVDNDGCIDFADMVWLPVALDLPFTRYDLLLVDESQDLSPVQQQITRRAGTRLVYCGDDRQAIYGFTGADVGAMSRLQAELEATDRGCTVLPLTVTRRCGKAIVAEARTLVRDFEAHEGNPEGTVTRAGYPANVEWEKSYGAMAKSGDMVLCRTNAPLVKNCFLFLKRNIKATIQGRDIGQGLITTVTKQKVATVGQLLTAIEAWSADEQRKERNKKNPSEGKLQAITDRADCIEAFCGSLKTTDPVSEVVRIIESIFTDDKTVPGIKLSSIHKAKGQEAHRVFFLEPKGAECPLPFLVPGTWQHDQDLNCRYVAITRSITDLVYVS